MPRSVEITVAPERTDALLSELRRVDGVVGISLQPGAGVQPSGDVLTVQTTNDGTRALLELLNRCGVLEGGSIMTSAPRSLLTPPHQNALEQESNETIWEEMAFLLRRETNVSANYLSAMGLAGAMAAVGLWTDTLHLVVGAMVVAPGFEPLLRLPFGLIGGPRVLMSRGVLSTMAGYLVLALGAALALLVLRVLDPGAPADPAARQWVQYWTSVQATGVLMALLAGAAGAVIVMAQRSVLTAGVMIALALVPGMTIAGMGLAAGDVGLAGQGLVRWAVDAAAVVAAGFLVLGLKQALQHRRRALA